LRASAALHGWAPTQPCLPTAGLLAQGQYDLDPLPPFPDHVQYTHYSDQIGNHPWEWGGPGPGLEREPHPALNIPLPVISAYLSPTPEPGHVETEPTEPGPLDCREEQYPCTRLYSIHKPCKQCLNEVCFYSLRRVYVVNKEICVRTVCAHEELLRADLCRDKFSKCGVMASSGLCQSVAASCARSCGGC
uniref:ShKT domain-containing protein n=1 Tax=Sus scrofa TaxID=9823 RepID=A0A8D0MU45_PIG